MFQLAWPWMGLAAAAPLLVAFTVPPAHRSAGAALRIPFHAWVATPVERSRFAPLRGSGLVALFAWLLLVLAACRPQWIHDPVSVPLSGRDLLLAVDISGSMKAKDLVLGGAPASRLDVVKEVAGAFIARRAGDRVGLVLFGSRPYLQTPLTFDLTSVRRLLGEAEIGLAGEQTAIGDAIGLALKRLRERPSEDRVLVLLTDGANTAGEVTPGEAAKLAAANAMKIYSIGVGSDERSVLGQSPGRAGALDEDTLRVVSDLTGGRYFRARDTRELDAIYALLDELEPIAGDQELLRPVRELFPYPLGAALLLSGGLLLAVLARQWRPPAGVGSPEARPGVTGTRLVGSRSSRE